MDYNELEPKIVFQYFKEVSNIPHGSGNTEEISKYLMNFAKEHNLKAIYDSGRNIIIFKDGTKGLKTVGLLFYKVIWICCVTKYRIALLICLKRA